MNFWRGNCKYDLEVRKPCSPGQCRSERRDVPRVGAESNNLVRQESWQNPPPTQNRNEIEPNVSWLRSRTRPTVAIRWSNRPPVPYGPGSSSLPSLRPANRLKTSWTRQPTSNV